MAPFLENSTTCKPTYRDRKQVSVAEGRGQEAGPKEGHEDPGSDRRASGGWASACVESSHPWLIHASLSPQPSRSHRGCSRKARGPQGRGLVVVTAWCSVPARSWRPPSPLHPAAVSTPRVHFLWWRPPSHGSSVTLRPHLTPQSSPPTPTDPEKGAAEGTRKPSGQSRAALTSSRHQPIGHRGATGRPGLSPSPGSHAGYTRRPPAEAPCPHPGSWP